MSAHETTSKAGRLTLECVNGMNREVLESASHDELVTIVEGMAKLLTAQTHILERVLVELKERDAFIDRQCTLIEGLGRRLAETQAALSKELPN